MSDPLSPRDPFLPRSQVALGNANRSEAELRRRECLRAGLTHSRIRRHALHEQCNCSRMCVPKCNLGTREKGPPAHLQDDSRYPRGSRKIGSTSQILKLTLSSRCSTISLHTFTSILWGFTSAIVRYARNQRPVAAETCRLRLPQQMRCITFANIFPLPTRCPGPKLPRCARTTTLSATSPMSQSTPNYHAAHPRLPARKVYQNWSFSRSFPTIKGRSLMPANS